MKIGDKIGAQHKETCSCGQEYFASRCDEKVITEKELYCNHCNETFKLDTIKGDLENAKKFIESLVEVSNELNYRLRKTDQAEGFHYQIELAEKFLEVV